MSIKRQSAWNMMPQLVTVVTGVVSVRWYLHYLTPEMYALWNYVAVFGGMFGFADLGLGVAVGRYVGVALGKNDLAAVRGYWGTGNLILIPFLTVASVALAVLGCWIGPKVLTGLSPVQISLLRACFLVAGFQLFFGYYSQYWLILTQAHLDFKFIGILRASMALLRFIPALALAWLTGNPLALVGWFTIISLGEFIGFVWHGRRHYQMGLDLRSASFARAREMGAYLGKNTIGLMVGAVFGQIDRQFLSKFAGASVNFRNYTVCANLGGNLQSLGFAVLGPLFYNTTRSAAGERNAAAAAIYSETFQFVFDWYLLVAIGVELWHPVVLRLWLGSEHARQFAPLFTPLIVAYCLNAMSNLSGSQLASLNRLGATIIFSIVAGLMAAAGVWIGWHAAGVVGAAYGFLCSRLALVAQDVFLSRLLGGGGWLDLRTWRKIAGQGLLATVFASAFLVVPRDSYWLLLPAALHGGLVAWWSLRHQVRKYILAASTR